MDALTHSAVLYDKDNDSRKLIITYNISGNNTRTLRGSDVQDLVPVAGLEPARVAPTDFELFASQGIQTNSTPYGGRCWTPKSPPLLTILKLMCKKAPFRLPFPHFSILTGILDFGGTSEGCNPQTEHSSTRNRFINRI